jgi:hypothetical protein
MFGYAVEIREGSYFKNSAEVRTDEECDARESGNRIQKAFSSKSLSELMVWLKKMISVRFSTLVLVTLVNLKGRPSWNA